MRDDTFYTKWGIFNLNPTGETHWVVFINEKDFDLYGYPPPLSITNHINKSIHPENQIQKKDTYCAAYSLYVLYLTIIIGFRNTVLNLYYQFYFEIYR